MKYEALKKNRANNLIKGLRTLGKAEDPLLAEKRQSFGLSLLSEFHKWHPNFPMIPETKLIEAYGVIETLTVYIENESADEFKRRRKALGLLSALLAAAKTGPPEVMAFLRGEVICIAQNPESLNFKLLKRNLGLIFLRIFDLVSPKHRLFILETLLQLSHGGPEGLIPVLRLYEKELSLVPRVFLLSLLDPASSQVGLRVLKALLSDLRIRASLRQTSDFLTNLGLSLLLNQGEAQSILESIRALLEPQNEAGPDFMSRASMTLTNPLFSVAIAGPGSDVQLSALNIVGCLSRSMDKAVEAGNVMSKLIEAYDAVSVNKVRDEAFEMIVGLSRRIPELSHLLMTSQRALELICDPEADLARLSFLLRTLYSEQHNVKTLNAFASKGLFASLVLAFFSFFNFLTYRSLPGLGLASGLRGSSRIAGFQLHSLPGHPRNPLPQERRRERHGNLPADPQRGRREENEGAGGVRHQPALHVLESDALQPVPRVVRQGRAVEFHLYGDFQREGSVQKRQNQRNSGKYLIIATPSKI